MTLIVLGIGLCLGYAAGDFHARYERRKAADALHELHYGDGEAELERLARIGLIVQTHTGFYVPNSTLTDAERQALCLANGIAL